jgi:hypothetical protein
VDARPGDPNQCRQRALANALQPLRWQARDNTLATQNGSKVVPDLPLLIAGGIKSAYDLTLWAVLRRVQPVDDDRA